MNLNPAIANLSVRSVHDGKTMAVLVEWKDATPNHTLVVDKFSDQVAIELPMQYQKDNLPSPMMGNPGGRVAIWQWRTALQHDAERGAPDIRKLYPNLTYDLYPDQVLPADNGGAV